MLSLAVDYPLNDQSDYIPATAPHFEVRWEPELCASQGPAINTVGITNLKCSMLLPFILLVEILRIGTLHAGSYDNQPMWYACPSSLCAKEAVANDKHSQPQWMCWTELECRNPVTLSTSPRDDLFSGVGETVLIVQCSCFCCCWWISQSLINADAGSEGCSLASCMSFYPVL